MTYGAWISSTSRMPLSMDGNKHCLIIVDAFSSYRTVLFAPTKNGLVPPTGDVHPVALQLLRTPPLSFPNGWGWRVG